MINSENSESENKESVGRIEVAPEVLTTIAQYVTLGVSGVNKMATVPSDVSRLFRRATRHDGILLDFANDLLQFEIYIFMDSQVNVLEASRCVQEAVIEAVDKMVGISINSVNVHVEDVVYTLDETA